MKLTVKLFSLLLICGFLNAQEITINQNKIEQYLKDLSKPKNELVVNSFLEESNQLDKVLLTITDSKFAVSSKNVNYQVPRKLVLKSSLRRGSLKVGSSYFSAQRIITGVDFDLFKSSIASSTIPFIKSTNIPYINAEAEYVILDNVGVGGFIGYQSSGDSNRGSDGVRDVTKTKGYVLGFQVTRYTQASNFLFIPAYIELNYENGKLNFANGVNFEDYNFQRFRIGAGIGLTLAVNDRVQIEFRGLDISHSDVVFSQTAKKLTDSDDTTISAQKINRTKLQFGTNPRIRILGEVFAFGRQR